MKYPDTNTDTGQKSIRILCASILILLICAGLFAGAGAAKWDGKSIDTSWYYGHSSPYHITTEAQLAGLTRLVNDNVDSFERKTIYLDNDLDLDNQPWSPIGYYKTELNSKSFKGTFDGQGYTIENLLIMESDKYLGLFGYVTGSNAKIQNLNIDGVGIVRTHILLNNYLGAVAGYTKGQTINCNVNHLKATGSITVIFGGSTVGGLVGKSTGLIKDCNVDQSIISLGLIGKNDVGGLAGIAEGRVENCTAWCTVTGNNRVGGLIGEAYGDVIKCTAYGNVKGNEKVGGLIGSVVREVKISDCHAFGDVTGEERVGGLIGSIDRAVVSINVNLEKCSAEGDVTGTNYVGGLVGWANAIINECNAAGTVTGKEYVGGLVGHANREIKNSYATGTVTGENRVGGLVGESNSLVHSTPIYNCHATGDVSGGYNLGGLAGYTDDHVRNSYATGNVNGIDDLGGLIGHAYRRPTATKEIDNCYATGDVTGRERVGGLIGYNQADVKFCHASGTVYGTSIKTGGLIGTSEYPHHNVIIKNCYATGDVTGNNNYVGGLIGYEDDKIDSCYASGKVTGKCDYVGGLLGYAAKTVTNCYASGDVTGVNLVGGLVGYANGKIINCYATGNARGNWRIGGIVGFADDNVEQSLALNKGTITGNDAVGKVAGEYDDWNDKSKQTYVWNGMMKSPHKVADREDDGNGEISSTRVWDTFPGNIWDELRFNSWKSNQGNPVFKLPIPNSLPYDLLSDASHLAPQVPFTVSFDTQGHGTAPAPQTIYYGGKVTRPADPTDPEYYFAGWFKEPECKNLWDFNKDSVTKDTTLYALWDKKEWFIVIFDTQGHGTAPDPQYVVKGGKAVKPAEDPVEPGWTFNGWYKDEECTVPWNFDTEIREHTTIYAGWMQNINLVLFDVQGHGTAPDPQLVPTGGKVSEPDDPEDEKFKFEGWYKEPGCISPWIFETDTVSAPLTLYAKWTALKKVTFDVQGHGTAPEPQYVDVGEKVTEPEDPEEEGYVFGGWFKEPVCSNKWDFETDTVSADTTLYAKWTKLFIVSFNTQ
ncbi:MAG TPA: InlB B-repeat-containing protein, partial [Methanocorpusculum sp.]|nr:InlB B-repeat-containing protein [Methanocorpusculum sp.]